MRLTTKGRFAVTAMIDVAMRQHLGPVTLAGISQRQHISLSYLEQLFGKLRRHELVDSVRGPGGGCGRAPGDAPPQNGNFSRGMVFDDVRRTAAAHHRHDSGRRP